MKVLLINVFHYRKGGSEAVYFNTAQILKGLGHEVIFFSTLADQNIDCEQSEYFCRNISDQPKMQGMVSYFYNFEAKKRLERLIEAEKPDIAHVHLFWGKLSPSIFAVLKRHNVPLIHTVHDYRMVCPAYTFNCNGKICERCKGNRYFNCGINRCSKGSMAQSWLMAMEMYLRNAFFNPLRNIDGFLFVSHFARNKHIEYNPGFSKANALVLYNFTKDSNPVFPKKTDDYFLYYGRLSYEKGILTLLKAMKKVLNVKLKVVGTGLIEDELKTYISENSISNVEMLGYMTGESLKQVVNNARFVIVPSEWYENNPMTIIEAYSMGVPVIGANIGGIPEIIKETQTGFLFQPGNAEELARILEDADKIDETQYQLMSKSAYQFFENHFSEKQYGEKLVDFYQQILGKK